MLRVESNSSIFATSIKDVRSGAVKQFIRIDENDNEVGTVQEAYVIGDSMWPEDPTSPSRFAGLTFRVTIAPDNSFRATVIDELVNEVERRGGSGPLNAGVRRWCATGRAQFWLAPDVNSDTVICVDVDDPGQRQQPMA